MNEQGGWEKSQEGQKAQLQTHSQGFSARKGEASAA